TMLAAGGEAIADIDTLRHQTAVLGPVASPPPGWRGLDEGIPAAPPRGEKVRAKVRRHVWSQMSGLPASKLAGTDLGETIVLAGLNQLRGRRGGEPGGFPTKKTGGSRAV